MVSWRSPKPLFQVQILASLQNSLKVPLCYYYSMNKEDWKHTKELGELKDTKYWFNKDIGTIKKSLRKSFKISPLLLLIALTLSLAYNYFYDTFFLTQVLSITMVFYMVILFSYILFYVIVKKGYNVGVDGGGTTIDEARNPIPKKKVDDYT